MNGNDILNVKMSRGDPFFFTGLGFYVPFCFTSPNYWGCNSSPTDIWFGDVKPILKKGHLPPPVASGHLFASLNMNGNDISSLD